MGIKKILLVASLLSVPQVAHADSFSTYWLAEMTSPEIQQAMDQGKKWVLVPTAGTEQNGPHLPLNKHREVLRNTSVEIAQRLGNALIAPIIEYVPEGDPHTREGHMAFAGTISLPEPVFGDVLEATAYSLLTHGFTHVLFIGDSGGNQAMQAQVAEKLQEQGRNVYHLSDYYANAAQEEWLVEQGFQQENIGRHAGLRDTSEFMAVAPLAVRKDKLQHFKEAEAQMLGAEGDAASATPELGEELLAMKVKLTIAQICRDIAEARDLVACHE